MKVRRRKKILSRQANEFLPKLRRRMIDAMSSKGRAIALKAWASVFQSESLFQSASERVG